MEIDMEIKLQFSKSSRFPAVLLTRVRPNGDLLCDGVITCSSTRDDLRTLAEEAISKFFAVFFEPSTNSYVMKNNLLEAYKYAVPAPLRFSGSSVKGIFSVVRRVLFSHLMGQGLIGGLAYKEPGVGVWERELHELVSASRAMLFVRSSRLD